MQVAGAAAGGRARRGSRRAAQHRPAPRAPRRPALPARPDSGVDRPALWLAGFAVVEAAGGEEAHVALELPARTFAHWAGADGWQIEGGAFEVLVGSSAADHPLRAEIDAPSCSL